MKPPIVINEARAPYFSGDVNFYDSTEEACLAMEPIDVQDQRYFAFDGDGVRLNIHTDGKKIWLSPTREVDKDALIGLIKDYLDRMKTASGKEWVLGYLSKIIGRW